MSVRIGGGGAAASGLSSASLVPAMPPGLQEAFDAFKAHQEELAGHVQKQTQFMAQHNENMLVKQELDKLKDGEHVYKLMGKVLVRQDPVEAKSTVAGRLDFIGKELKKSEDAIEATRTKLMKARGRIMEIQQAAAAAASGGAGAGGAAGGAGAATAKAR